jgi:hypothetical protein
MQANRRKSMAFLSALLKARDKNETNRSAVAGGNRGQIKLDVSRLRGALDVEQRFGAVVRGGIGRVGIGVAAGSKLRAGAGQQTYRGQQEYR